MDFIQTRRRISYRDRMNMLRQKLEKSETREVTVTEMQRAWQLTPPYVVKLMRWFASYNEHVMFDETYGVLFYASTASPTYRGITKQKTLETV